MNRNDETKLAQLLAELINKQKIKVLDRGTYLEIRQGKEFYKIELAKRDLSRLIRYR